jgi:hypothetical protein
MEVTRCLASEDTMHDENVIKMAQRDGTAALIYCQRRAATPDKLEYMGDVARGGCWIWSAKSRNKSDVAFQSLGMRGKLPALSHFIQLLQRPAIDGLLYT